MIPTFLGKLNLSKIKNKEKYSSKGVKNVQKILEKLDIPLLFSKKIPNIKENINITNNKLIVIIIVIYFFTSFLLN
ncbi:MAG: hypothetical protein HW401_350 [Parcubacteria group bacterium]|nr:hypothetical protein [Parcubacteria group bacterium]